MDCAREGGGRMVGGRMLCFLLGKPDRTGAAIANS